MSIKTWYVLGASVLLAFAGLGVLTLQMRSASDTSSSESPSLIALDNSGTEASVEVVSTDAGAAGSESTSIPAAASDMDGLSDTDMEMKLAGLPTSRDMQQSREHRYARGDFALEDIPIYEAYTTEVLENLAWEGDFVASHVLALRYGQQGRSQEMQQVWMSAAIFGSTGTLLMYAQYNIAQSDPEYGEQDSEKARRSLLNGLGAYEFARIRGDLMVDRMIQDNVIDAGIELSEADWEEARKIGQDFYDLASRKRVELGLPEFDNSISEGARAVGETYAKGYRALD